MIEKLYEEVLLEQSIKDWLMQNKSVVKEIANYLGSLGIVFTSMISMGIYVSQFLEKNFPNLPEQTIEKIAQFIANNPQILNLIK